MLSWIKEKYDAEIIAFCANIGQEEELKGLEAKASKHRRVQVLHRRSAGGIRPRLHLPDDPGRRDL